MQIIDNLSIKKSFKNMIFIITVVDAIMIYAVLISISRLLSKFVIILVDNVDPTYFEQKYDPINSKILP